MNDLLWRFLKQGLQLPVEDHHSPSDNPGVVAVRSLHLYIIIGEKSVQGFLKVFYQWVSQCYGDDSCQDTVLNV